MLSQIPLRWSQRGYFHKTAERVLKTLTIALGKRRWAICCSTTRASGEKGNSSATVEESEGRDQGG